MRFMAIFICLLAQASSQTQGTSTTSTATTTTTATPTTTTTTTTLTTTTTTTITTTTATPETTKKPSLIPQLNRTEFHYGYYCTCDLTSNHCDVNCCCDPDCQSNDIETFSGCHHVDAYETDQRYCHHSEIVVKNNTQYVVQKSPDKFGNVLFCVVKDNLEDHRRFLDQSPIENSTEFELVLGIHKGFHALRASLGSELENPFKANIYMAGGPIWTMERVNEDLGILTLPSKLNHMFCGSAEPLRFMEDLEARKCLVQLYLDEACSSKPELDANTYLSKDHVVIRSPQLFRNRSLPNVQAFLNVEHQLCSPHKIRNSVDGVLNTMSCVNLGRDFQIPSPTRDCKNVLKSLHYEIHHEGIKGITKIFANLELVDLSSSGPYFFRKSGDVLTISQEFGYTHFWTTDNVTEKIQRSGNPGYILGKPLLTGVLGIRKDLDDSMESEESNAPVYYIKQNPLNQAMTTLVPTGLCEDPKLSRRQRVLFGMDSFSGCQLRVKRSDLSKDCEQIKDKILHLLLGSPTHKGVNEIENLRVASFGNSDPNKAGDWVKIQITRPPKDNNMDTENSTAQATTKVKSPPGTCKDVVQSLHIEIAYAYIGSTANPQAKIVGVNYKFGRSKDVKFQCVGMGSCRSVKKTQNIDVSTSVSFVDVTKPALRYYAEYPVLTIRLPYDFFYPFVSVNDLRSYSPPVFSSLSLIVFMVLSIGILH